jgi:hypothetical protein
MCESVWEHGARVKLDLVDGRDDGRNREEAVKVLDREIGHADRAQLLRILLLESLHRLPGVEPVDRALRLRWVLLGVRSGPVHEPEVEVVRAERLERRFERGLGLGLVGVVELGGEEEGLAGDARCLDALADLVLVLVRGGSYTAR